VLGKGVLVQTTLWGNLILGPTSLEKADAANMSAKEIETFILSKCKRLVPDFDPTMTFHTFSGARAKSDRGDWIIEASATCKHFIHVAGIDSPGLAGAPAIALRVVELLKEAGLKTPPNSSFNPYRAPIITPKNASNPLKNLKAAPVEKMVDSRGSDEAQMAANVVCKCEKVTELEVVRAMHRSLPIDSSQAIRKRTRAGMGSCQAKCSEGKYNCEARVRAIIARENGTPVSQVGGRPWPATSFLPRRWLSDLDKAELLARKEEIEN
jgi:glycerol-3-phosphate dehydrogenase